jgi:hypothetical protein
MFLTLFDHHKDQEISLEVTVEYTTPAAHLLLVVATVHATDEAPDGSESPPFGQYRFKALHHLSGVKFRHEGKPYALTVGFYWESQALGFIPVVLDQGGNQQRGRFTTAPRLLMPDDAVSMLQEFEQLFVLDRREYQAVQELGLESGSWPEYVSRTLEASQVGPWNRVYYDLTIEAKDTFSIADLVDEERFYEFMAEHDWPPHVPRSKS